MSLLFDVSTLAELPKVLAERFGEKAAVIGHDGTLTYRQLEQRVNTVANRLLALGISNGDRVAVLARDSVASVPLLFAAAKARAIWTGINWRLSEDELAAIIRDASPSIVFFDPEFAPGLRRSLASAGASPSLVALSRATDLGMPLEDWLSSGSGAPPALAYSPEDPVVQLYTSGTTGLPKGVQLPSRSFFAIPREMLRRDEPFLGWTSDDVSLLFVPTFFVAAAWWFVHGLSVGSTHVVLPGFDPGQVLRAIPQYGVTKMGLVPAMLQMILAEPGFAKADLSSLRTILYGGSPIALQLLERAKAGFGCEFYQAYGMTETGNVAVCLGPAEHTVDRPELLRSAGRPLPGVSVRILRLDGTEAAVGEQGEIAIQSPARMCRYWNNPDATAAVLLDGWVMTGDIGWVDAEGYVYVVDRIKDMMICAGENIYPAEIEKVLRTHPDIIDVAVIGIPNELWGEEIMAFAVARPNSKLTSRDVVIHARAHLASYKAPNRVEIVEQLPRSASGKVLKRKLREPYWKGRERQVI